MENIRSNFSDTNQGLEDRGVILGSAPDFLNEPDNSLLCAAGWHIPSGNHNNLLPSPGGGWGAAGLPLCALQASCKRAPNSERQSLMRGNLGKKRVMTLFRGNGRERINYGKHQRLLLRGQAVSLCEGSVGDMRLI